MRPPTVAHATGLKGHGTVLGQKRPEKKEKSPAALHNAKKPHAAHAAFAQPAYFLVQILDLKSMGFQQVG